MKILRLSTAVLFAAVLTAGQVDAMPRSATIRGGFGAGPDQGVVGVQAMLGPVFKALQFAPSADLGFGDNVTTFALNGDFALPLAASDDKESVLYASTGPSVVYWSADSFSDTEIGWSASAGVRKPLGRNTFNLETRFGIGDVPDLRVLLGIVF